MCFVVDNGQRISSLVVFTPGQECNAGRQRSHFRPVQIARGGDHQIPSIGSLPGRAGFRMLAGHSIERHPTPSRRRFSVGLLRTVSAFVCARAPRSSNRHFHCLFLVQGTQNRWFVASRRTSAIDPRSTRVQPPCTIFKLLPMSRWSGWTWSWRCHPSPSSPSPLHRTLGPQDPH